MITVAAENEKLFLRARRTLLSFGIFSERKEDGALSVTARGFVFDKHVYSLMGGIRLESALRKYFPNEFCLLSYGHLTVGNNKSDVALLGYPFPVRKVDFCILRRLCLAAGAPVSRTILRDFCLSPLSDPRVLSNHVHYLNEKARALGGRSLILSTQKGGYYLNPSM